ncbi:MAG: hypothetical protein U0P81_11595 [Holophagaceae bacterium]
MALRRAFAACALLALPALAADNGATGRIGPVQGRASTAAFFVAIPDPGPKMPEKPVYMIRFYLADTHVQLGFFPSGRIYVLRAEPGEDRWIPVKEFDHVDIHVLAAGQKGEDAAALLKAPPKASGPLKPGERYLLHLKGTLKGVGPLMGRTQDMDVWAWGQLAAMAPPE